MSYSDILQRLLPIELGGDHSTDLAVEANSLELAQASASTLTAEMFPDTAASFLTAWERVLAIAPAPDAMRSERVAEIVFRLRSLGRLDRQYFIDIAATVGYVITITELQPLMAGWAQSGSAVLADYVRWIWTVTITDGFNRFAHAGAAAAGEPIAWFRDKRHLDDIFNSLKPAHTLVIFI